MRACVLAVGLAATLLAAGCGSGGGPVEGNVVLGGKAYNPASDGDMQVRLSNGSKAYTGKVEPDGTFKITATDGPGGVPAGKYKVSVTRYPVIGKDDGKAAKGPPMASNKDYPEEWVVAAGTKYTLDLSKVK